MSGSLNPVQKRVYLRRVRKFRRDCHNLDAFVPQLISEFGGMGEIAAMEHKIAAQFRQSIGQIYPDAAARAGHERPFSFK
jgi:hypothetical protein